MFPCIFSNMSTKFWGRSYAGSKKRAKLTRLKLNSNFTTKYSQRTTLYSWTFFAGDEKPEHQRADFYATTVILLKPGIMKMLLGEFQGPPGLMTHCAGLMAVTPLKLNHPKTILVSFMLKLVIKRWRLFGPDSTTGSQTGKSFWYFPKSKWFLSL